MQVALYPPTIIDIVVLALLALGFILPLILFPKRFVALAKLLRPLRLIHYAGFAAGGVVIGAVVGKVSLDPYLVFFSIASALFAFQGAVFLNDIFDAEIDRLASKPTPFSKGVVSLKSSCILAVVLSAVSLLLSLRCGLWSFFFILSFHLVSLLYSTPLLRLKRFYPLNVFLLALAGLAIMISGYASHAAVRLFPVRMLVLVLVTLTATFGTKDMADVEGDRQRGVRTLFTLLGFERGLWVNAALVLLSYLATPLILGYPPLFWAATPAAVLSSFFVLYARKHTRLAEALILAAYILFGLLMIGFIAAGEIF